MSDLFYSMLWVSTNMLYLNNLRDCEAAATILFDSMKILELFPEIPDFRSLHIHIIYLERLI